MYNTWVQPKSLQKHYFRTECNVYYTYTQGVKNKAYICVVGLA